MNNQEIIDNAPEGATHINAIGTTLFSDKEDGIRSLSDIKRIVELEDLVKEAFEEGYYEGVNFPSPLGCKWDESFAKRDLAILKEDKDE
jgi:hypothetical protein